jgi:hypothetical protein
MKGKKLYKLKIVAFYMINILGQLFTIFYVQSKADIMNYSLMAIQLKKKPHAYTFGLSLNCTWLYILL